MKTLVVFLLALLVGFAGYRLVYPKLEDWAKLTKVGEPVVAVRTEQQPKSGRFEIPAPKPQEPEPMKEEPKMEPKPEVKPEPAPMVVEAPKKEPNPDEFQPPVFPPIEQVVKNWREIPRGAFPREATLLKDVEFSVNMKGNKLSTKVSAGNKVQVLEQVGDNVVVAPTATSPARVEVALTDTDLKQLLTDAYERWKPEMVKYLQRQWEFKKMAKSSSGGATNPKVAGRNDKPERNPDGSYPILLASMKSGGVTEITPANVRKWGDLNMQKIDGQEYFTIIVDYTTKTMFGDFTTSAQARIRDGKVVKWIYTGSGEVVP